MELFGRRKKTPQLTREESLGARPVLNQLVRIETGPDGQVVLNVPRRKTPLLKIVSRLFKIPPDKQIELDELGTYVIQHCDGAATVAELIDGFAHQFQLHRREAEVSMLTFLKTLAQRGIIGFAIHDPSLEKGR